MRKHNREPGHHAVNEHGIYMEDLLMERILGRSLKPSELVLHRNHDPLDNRRANLYLTVNGVEVPLEPTL